MKIGKPTTGPLTTDNPEKLKLRKLKAESFMTVR
jgi:hypothetical protein